MKITAYTDGSAVTSYPYLGGCGVYIKTHSKTFKIRKGYSNTKTGRMELIATLTCLKSIKNKSYILTIYSDSQYVCNTCNKWIENWERNLWVDKKNVDILKELLFELRRFQKRPKLIHIKGHQKIADKHTEGNNIADKLACYSTQKSHEVDLPLDDLDLTKIEKKDFIQKGNKWYYEENSYINKEFESYKNKRIGDLKKDMSY